MGYVDAIVFLKVSQVKMGMEKHACVLDSGKNHYWLDLLMHRDKSCQSVLASLMRKARSYVFPLGLLFCVYYIFLSSK